MLKTSDVCKAIRSAVGGVFPEMDIVTGPKREPRSDAAFYLEFTGQKTQRENAGMVSKDLTFLLSCLADRQEFLEEDQFAMMDVQDKLLNLFSAGQLKAADRRLTLTASSNGAKAEGFTATIQITYFDALDLSEDYLLIQEVQTKVSGQAV